MQPSQLRYPTASSLAGRGLREPWAAAGGASEEDLREDLQELTRLPGEGGAEETLLGFQQLGGFF